MRIIRERDTKFTVHMKDSQERHLERIEKAALQLTYDALMRGKFANQGLEVGQSQSS